MKNTKNAQKKRKGDKISFRINQLEDKKIIKYIDDAKNGSGFIKEALKFYIMAIEKGLVTSYYLTNEENEWDEILKAMNASNAPKAPENNIEIKEDDTDIEAPDFNIYDFDDRIHQESIDIPKIESDKAITVNRISDREELTADDLFDDDYFEDDYGDFMGAQ